MPGHREPALSQLHTLFWASATALGGEGSPSALCVIPGNREESLRRLSQGYSEQAPLRQPEFHFVYHVFLCIEELVL